MFICVLGGKLSSKLWMIIMNEEQMNNQVGRKIDQQLWDQLNDQFWLYVERHINWQVWWQVYRQVDEQVWRDARKQVMDDYHDNM